MAILKPKFPLLTESARASLFQQFGQMARAGLSAEQWFDTSARVNPRLAPALAYLKSRMASWSVARAGYMAGIFSGFDQQCIQVAEQTGRYDQVLFYLADFYLQLTQRKRQMQSRMIYPVLIVLAAFVITPLPELILGTLSLSGYFKLLALKVIILLALLWLLLNFTALARSGILPGLRGVVDRFQVELPLISGWYYRRVMFHFFSHLHLLYAAGVPVIQAWSQAMGLIPNLAVRSSLERAWRELDKGASLTDAILLLPSLDPMLIQFMQTGETAGTVDAMLKHFIHIEAEQLAMDDKMLADWIPRMVYLGVSLWVAYGIISKPIVPHY